MSRSSRKFMASLAAVAMLSGAAIGCSDDDADDDIENPDLDPGEGEGGPGDGTVETPDLDPGEGEGGPGDGTLGD
jgi:hypothetical protein